MDILKFNGYEGTSEVDMVNKVCFGKILFINDLVSYEATSPAGLQTAFEEAVSDYLETCKQVGKAAEKPLKGSFNVRVPPELHRQATCMALSIGSSLNDVVSRALNQYINGQTNIHNHNTTVNINTSQNQTYQTRMSGKDFSWVSPTETLH